VGWRAKSLDTENLAGVRCDPTRKHSFLNFEAAGKLPVKSGPAGQDKERFA
jgi:hypothetical protein